MDLQSHLRNDIEDQICRPSRKIESLSSLQKLAAESANPVFYPLINHRLLLLNATKAIRASEHFAQVGMFSPVLRVEDIIRVAERAVSVKRRLVHLSMIRVRESGGIAEE